MRSKECQIPLETYRTEVQYIGKSVKMGASGLSLRVDARVPDLPTGIRYKGIHCTHSTCPQEARTQAREFCLWPPLCIQAAVRTT